MTDVREIIAKRIVGPKALDWADAVIEALHAAGYRILGPDEVDPVTVERCAEVAERLAEDRKTKEQEIGGWPWTATPIANHFWCEEIAAAIRALGRKA